MNCQHVRCKIRSHRLLYLWAVISRFVKSMSHFWGAYDWAVWWKTWICLLFGYCTNILNCRTWTRPYHSPTHSLRYWLIRFLSLTFNRRWVHETFSLCLFTECSINLCISERFWHPPFGTCELGRPFIGRNCCLVGTESARSLAQIDPSTVSDGLQKCNKHCGSGCKSIATSKWRREENSHRWWKWVFYQFQFFLQLKHSNSFQIENDNAFNFKRNRFSIESRVHSNKNLSTICSWKQWIWTTMHLMWGKSRKVNWRKQTEIELPRTKLFFPYSDYLYLF